MINDVLLGLAIIAAMVGWLVIVDWKQHRSEKQQTRKGGLYARIKV